LRFKPEDGLREAHRSELGMHGGGLVWRVDRGWIPQGNVANRHTGARDASCAYVDNRVDRHHYTLLEDCAVED